MKTVNMHEAKTHLSRLVEAASKGEPFVIARAGKPLVKVVAVEEAAPVRKSPFGFLKGQFTYDPEVDRQLDEEIREMFEASIRDSPLDWGGPGEAGDDGAAQPGEEADPARGAA